MGGRAAGGWRWQVSGRGGQRLAHHGQLVQEFMEGLVVQGAHDGGDGLLDLGQQAVQDGLGSRGEVDQDAKRISRFEARPGAGYVEALSGWGSSGVDGW